jgi:uncharacterized protein YdhG (YjbR/CyaY superfamily)
MKPARSTKDVDSYIADCPLPARTALNTVRRAIRKALPRAEEVISYAIPAYRLHGSTVIYFAAWREHYSIYPANARLVAAFGKQLAPYEVNNKGTIRFPLSGRVPVTLIGNLAKFLAREAADRAKVKAAAAASKPKRRQR